MSEILFNKVDYSLSSLLDAIELGTIGLPDIQRQFIWRNVKVRDLFDSMYQGYPIGYFLFWKNGLGEEGRKIGIDKKQKVPSLLIVDGQQRLTSLYSVIKGVSVVRENYNKEYIEIAFNPLNDKFEVADAAIQRDPQYVPNISIIWEKDADVFCIVEDYVERLKASRESTGKTLEKEEIKRIKKSITKLSNLLSFPFSVLELSPLINEEQVAEVFVRINSKGITLNQADFILTLMSVFWDEGRRELEEFSRLTRYPEKGYGPFNYFIEPDPDQLLRVSVGLGFRRARLRYAYALLRGKDLETEEFSEKKRIEQFKILKKAQAETLDLQNWQDYFKVIQLAGFRGSRMISSKITLLYSYMLYLIGKKSIGVDRFTLSNKIAKWFFMASLTGRYTGGAPETIMERDLADIRNLKGKKALLDWIDKTIDSIFTDDFWAITLPNQLETSSATSPVLYAYFAALNLLDAKALYSNKKVVDLIDEAQQSKRKAVERHHLFPSNYLKKMGINQIRDLNQIANYSIMERGDNIEISDRSPSNYCPSYERRFSPQKLHLMCHWHALPKDWKKMDYFDFLESRRNLMAKIIRDGYKKIAEGSSVKEADSITRIQDGTSRIKEIIRKGESSTVEFKSTLRINLHTKQRDSDIEHGCLKTIAAFLNSEGGSLIIGINDDGEPIGIDEDGFKNEDKMSLHLVNLIKRDLGPHNMLYINQEFGSYKGKRILIVECKPSKSPVYMKKDLFEHFYIRTGPANTELLLSKVQEYIQRRF